MTLKTKLAFLPFLFSKIIVKFRYSIVAISTQQSVETIITNGYSMDF